MLSYLQNTPGIDAAVETAENEFTFGPAGVGVVRGGTIDSTSVDTGSPTTLLRPGLLMGIVTATGYFKNCLSTATDGSQHPVGFLLEHVNMYDPMAGAVRAKTGKVLYTGHVKVANLYGFDEYARGLLSPRFVFDDLRQVTGAWKTVTKATDYTVLAADNGTHFNTAGAAGAVVFTLPAITDCRGYRFRFTNVANQNMTVTAPANKLVTFNNLTATSVAFSTSNEKIGASVEIVALPDSSKYLALPSGANTLTVA